MVLAVHVVVNGFARTQKGVVVRGLVAGEQVVAVALKRAELIGAPRFALGVGVVGAVEDLPTRTHINTRARGRRRSPSGSKKTARESREPYTRRRIIQEGGKNGG